MKTLTFTQESKFCANVLGAELPCEHNKEVVRELLDSLLKVCDVPSESVDNTLREAVKRLALQDARSLTFLGTLVEDDSVLALRLDQHFSPFYHYTEEERRQIGGIIAKTYPPAIIESTIQNIRNQKDRHDCHNILRNILRLSFRMNDHIGLAYAYHFLPSELDKPDVDEILNTKAIRLRLHEAFALIDPEVLKTGEIKLK